MSTKRKIPRRPIRVNQAMNKPKKSQKAMQLLSKLLNPQTLLKLHQKKPKNRPVS